MILLITEILLEEIFKASRTASVITVVGGGFGGGFGGVTLVFNESKSYVKLGCFVSSAFNSAKVESDCVADCTGVDEVKKNA